MSSARPLDLRDQGFASDPRLPCAARRAWRAHDVLRERRRARLHRLPLSRQGSGRVDRYPRRPAPSRVRCEPEERDYILDAVRSVFPKIRLSAKNVVFSYSGIRPLPRSDHEFTGRISRGHFIHRLDGAVPQFCMVGGKWTTFRAFAEQAADAVLAELTHDRARDTLTWRSAVAPAFPRRRRPRGGSRPAPRHRRRARGPSRRPYGTRAEEVLAFCLGRDDDEPLDEACVLRPRPKSSSSSGTNSSSGSATSCCGARRWPSGGTSRRRIVDRIAEIMPPRSAGAENARAGRSTPSSTSSADYHGVSRADARATNQDRSSACASAPKPA